jgi:FkbM family methyltransferase
MRNKNNTFTVFIVKLFMRVHEYFHTVLNINLKGVGFFYKHLNYEDYFRFGKKFLYYNPNVRGSYARLINGKYNEPETHIFIRNILNRFNDTVFTLVEVGGNVGEFLIDFGGEKQIEKFYVFEPQSECISALNKTVIKNNFKNVSVVPKAAYDSDGYVSFEKTESFSSSHIDVNGNSEFKVETVAIDSLNINPKNLIMLLDAEGAELKIMRGARALIKKEIPLIIFEYNFVTKEHFSIDEVLRELGGDYRLYRLIKNGKLNGDLEGNIWNLVAVNKNGFFKNVPVQ